MISDIEVIIEKFKKGEMVILVDDEDRENEGDLIVSSQYLTPEHINFMITYAKGLVCAPIAKDVATKLKLSLMQGIDNEEYLLHYQYPALMKVLTLLLHLLRLVRTQDLLHKLS